MPMSTSMPSTAEPLAPPSTETAAGAHIDQLLRQTRMHHVQLSVMADLKANMLLTIASVVITLSVPQLLQGRFVSAFSVLVAACLATILLAAYATMPKASIFTNAAKRSDAAADTFNLLFFGDFVRLPYRDFRSLMDETFQTPEAVYERQVREIYTLGVFLAHKKYRYLRLAYVTLIVGFVASVIVLFFTVGSA